MGAVAAGAAVAGTARLTGAPASVVAMLASTAVAAIGFFRAAGSSHLRRSLVLLGWSATAWTAGIGSWLVVESMSGAGSGLNPLSGGLILAGSGLALAGMLAVPGAPSTLGGKLRLVVDGLLVATSLLFIAWEPLIEPALGASGQGIGVWLGTLALPVADMVILAVIAAVIWHSVGGRVMLGLLAASVVLHAAADAIFAYYAFGGFAAHGDVVCDYGWALSYALLALAAVASGSAAARGLARAHRAPGLRTQVLPYVPVGAALTTAVAVGLIERRMHGAQLTVLLLIAVLLVARQWITMGENRQLSSGLRSRPSTTT